MKKTIRNIILPRRYKDTKLIISSLCPCVFVVLISFFICCLGCSSQQQSPEIPFDKTKWETQEGKDYPYRNQMVNDVLYNDSLRTLNQEQILNHLGEPSYTRKKFLYYRITETRLGAWILHTKTIVIKLSEDNSVEWIKLHE